MELFTIGDSLSQGFMSLAAARTDLSFSTLLAAKLGLGEGNYSHPHWPHDGLPLNLEAILRELHRRYGPDIGGLEWLGVPLAINQVVDRAEDHYERGEGAADQPYHDGAKFFHNVAVTGFTVADAWLVTPRLCREVLGVGTRRRPKDNFLEGPDNVLYRAALKILNPSLDPQYDDYSQLTWLDHHARAEGGVENLLLWLGANNALGSVVTLKPKPTPPDLAPPPHERGRLEREQEGWNLWHPNAFHAEYRALLDAIDKSMQANDADNWRVFIGTVPLVTIAPLAKGVGEPTTIERDGRPCVYFKYYTYFPFEEAFARETGIHLTMQQALRIDDSIRAYNRAIKAEVVRLNEAHRRERYHVVDIADALDRIAIKRNAGQPSYDFPDYIDAMYPMVDTKYYHASADGRLMQGGLFSLDGVHPSAIGHGLLAWEFLKVMAQVGAVGDADLPWASIVANDQLYNEPIPIMQELYRKDGLAQHVIRLIRLMGRAPEPLR